MLKRWLTSWLTNSNRGAEDDMHDAGRREARAALLAYGEGAMAGAAEAAQILAERFAAAPPVILDGQLAADGGRPALVAADTAEPAEPASEPQADADEQLTAEQLAEQHTKAELAEMAAGAGVDFKPAWRKLEIAGAIVSAS